MCIACRSQISFYIIFPKRELLQDSGFAKHYRTFVTVKIHTSFRRIRVFTVVQNNIHVHILHPVCICIDVPTYFWLVKTLYFFFRAVQSYPIYFSLPSGQLPNQLLSLTLTLHTEQGLCHIATSVIRSRS